MKHLFTCLLLIVASLSAHGFALRGPLEQWMTPQIGYDLAGDNGGPMALGNEYRWNLPVLTYGFDQSFLDYFGERGVQAVDEAVAILNALPPASEIDLGEFPTNTHPSINFEAETLHLIDLKSYALSALVQQLGLTEPERYVWSLRSRHVIPTPEGPVTNYAVIQRNYDPHTLQTSNSVNGIEYTYEIINFRNPEIADALEFVIDPLSFAFNSVAGFNVYWGNYYTGLTCDDAGGLRYLYNPANINIEPLPAGVTAGPGNSQPLVNVAPRPGVNKITFTRMEWDTNLGAFRATTNIFSDTYLSNGVPVQQTLQRVLNRPDITFRARDFPLTFRYNAAFDLYSVTSPFFERSPVSTWINNAGLNDATGSAGPGTIPSGQVIDFSTYSRYRQLESPFTSFPGYWGSFDGSTNLPVSYGLNDSVTSVTIETGITNGSFVWKLLGTYEAVYRIDTTTNLTDWTALTTVTNSRAYFSITNSATAPRQFYRAVRTSTP